MVLGDRHAEATRRGGDIAAVLAGMAHDLACRLGRAPPRRCGAGGIARDDKTAVPGDGDRGEIECGDVVSYAARKRGDDGYGGARERCRSEPVSCDDAVYEVRAPMSV